jgi:hypothetical protein
MVLSKTYKNNVGGQNGSALHSVNDDWVNIDVIRNPKSRTPHPHVISHNALLGSLSPLSAPEIGVLFFDHHEL